MIKLAILGVANPIAGELIRILVNHPEVELVLLYDLQHAGQTPTDIHHGLIGESLPRISSEIPAVKDVNALIVIEQDAFTTPFVKACRKADVKIVDMTEPSYHSLIDDESTLGLSEIFRKVLVRGESSCVVPRPIETAALISLYPLAKNLLLNSAINLEVETAKDIADDYKAHCACNVAKYVLSKAQQSFNHPITYSLKEIGNNRCLRLRCKLQCSLSLDDILELYDNIYDDHNFTILTKKVMDLKEVEGTNKCLVTIIKERPDVLAIDTIIDARLRGGAGEAVHALNLMFGLHECVGLTFKASAF
jgi:N-acetyl-gamma-glutamyl-phosphate reductase